MNDKNIKCIALLNTTPGAVKKCFLKVGKFFPLFLMPLVVGCQSGLHENSISLNLSPETTHLEGLANDASKPNSNSSSLENKKSNDIVLNNNSSKGSSLQAFNKKNNTQNSSPLNPKQTAYAPSQKPLSPEENILSGSEDLSTLQSSDEIDDQENLILTSTDDALSADNPLLNSSDDMGANLQNPNEDSALLCEDSVYYDSWQEQFDKSWMQENSKNYKTNASRNRALAQARTNRFIQIAYPTIDRLEFDFPVVINSQVLQWINYFRGSGRKSFVVWLKRSRSVIPDMEKTLEKYGLPKDLVYLSMIESGYSPKALSYAGAVGLWQFMPPTAREYGLKINDYVDERRDIKKSTKAAATYLTYLYTMFGSWHLAAASYNGGPGRVQRTLRNYGEDYSFFELTSMGVVNRQTADYVPKLIAAMIIAKNPDKFGFDTTSAPLPSPTKTILLTRSISISDLARSMNVDKNVLETLNPELRLGITPPPHATSGGKFELEVPSSKYDIALASIDLLPNAPTKYMIAARIKRRETVSSFAARYRINTALVLRANAHLKANSSLHKGQVVYIPVSLGSGQYERLSSHKYANAKSIKKGKTKKHQLARNVSSKKGSVKAPPKNSKSFVHTKKITRSAALRKKSPSTKKVATAGQRKKQHSNVH